MNEFVDIPENGSVALPLFMSSVMDFGVDPSICWLFCCDGGRWNAWFSFLEKTSSSSRFYVLPLQASWLLGDA